MKLRQVILAVLVATQIVRAQTNALTLADAQRLALERNWDLLAARSSLDLATAQSLVAREFPNPNLAVSTAKIGNGEASTPTGNGIWARSYDTIFAVNQLIEIGGKRHDRQVAARAGRLSARARFVDAGRLLAQGVTKSYAAVLLAEENEQVLRASVTAMQREADIAAARFQAGDLAAADWKQIQVAAGQYELQAASAALANRQARIALEIVLGVPRPQGSIQLLDSLEQLSAVNENTTSPGTNALRPDVLAARSDLTAARANLQLQKAGRIPDPTVALQFEHNPPDGGPPTDTVGFGVSFPLPLWNLNQGNIAAARAAVAQSELALARLQAQAEGDLAVALAAVQEASGRYQRYTSEISPRSAAARMSVAFKFEKGGASLVDLLEAERADNDVRLATAQALADTITTRADLTAARQALTVAELPDKP